MNDEATIRKNIDLWMQQYNNHDATGLASWYTKDSVYIAPTGVALIGPDQIRQYFEASFKRSPKAEVSVRVEQIRIDRPDLAIGRGAFELTNIVDPNGKTLSVKGPWVTSFVMQTGRWIPLTHASTITLEGYAPLRAAHA